MSYINLLTTIKNAQAVKKMSLKAPFSQMSMDIIKVLIKTGYLKDAEKKGRMPKRIIDLKLKYNNGKGAINGIKLVSRPSRRVYAGYRDIKEVKHGYGLLVLSTSRGIMTGVEAKKIKIGGEVLFQIW